MEGSDYIGLPDNLPTAQEPRWTWEPVWMVSQRNYLCPVSNPCRSAPHLNYYTAGAILALFNKCWSLQLGSNDGWFQWTSKRDFFVCPVQAENMRALWNMKLSPFAIHVDVREDWNKGRVWEILTANEHARLTSNSALHFASFTRIANI
jgi:hypothetical protein